MKYFRFVAVLLLPALLTISACKKDKPDMHGYVREAKNGTVLPGATLQLYSNYDNWKNAGTPDATYTTNSDGYFEIKGLPNGANNYYFYIFKDTLNNWVPGHEYTYLPNNEEASILLYNTFYRWLANTEWKLIDIRKNNASIWNTADDCEKDNTIFISRGFDLVIRENDSICPGEPGEFSAKIFIYGIGKPDTKPRYSLVDYYADFQISEWVEFTNQDGRFLLSPDKTKIIIEKTITDGINDNYFQYFYEKK